MGTKYVDQEVWRSKWMGGGKNLAAGKKNFILLCSVADPGSGAFLTLDPGSGYGIQDGKKSRSGIRDEHLGSYF
jgi:hypothetical protein